MFASTLPYRFLLCGGGTAGHINPALSIAESLKERYPNAKFLFVGTERGLEASLVPSAGYKIKFINVSGLKRSLSFENILIIRGALKAIKDSKKIIKDFVPDVVIGTGGYVSGPVVYAAQKMGIKTVIHEQNAYWGITTKLLSKKANKVLLGFKPVHNKRLRKNIVVTGNPIRKELFHFEKQSSRRVLGVDSRPLILSFGGSGGANKINTAVCHMLALSNKEKLFNHIHGSGKREFTDVVDYLLDEKVKLNGNIKVFDYIYDMPRILSACDLVVCRAGAITLAELVALGKPSILIPSPNVTENHQFHNAMQLVNAGAALLIEDKDLSGELLYKKMKELFADYDKIIKMSYNAKKLSANDANEKINSCITSVLESDRKK